MKCDLPRLTSAQANALRLSARDGLHWNHGGNCWAWGDASVGVQAIRQATVDALDRRDCLDLTRSSTLHPSDTGRAWLAANPDGKA